MSKLRHPVPAALVAAVVGVGLATVGWLYYRKQIAEKRDAEKADEQPKQQQRQQQQQQSAESRAMNLGQQTPGERPLSFNPFDEDTAAGGAGARASGRAGPATSASAQSLANKEVSVVSSVFTAGAASADGDDFQSCSDVDEELTDKTSPPPPNFLENISTILANQHKIVESDPSAVHPSVVGFEFVGVPPPSDQAQATWTFDPAVCSPVMVGFWKKKFEDIDVSTYTFSSRPQYTASKRKMTSPLDLEFKRERADSEENLTDGNVNTTNGEVPAPEDFPPLSTTVPAAHGHHHTEAPASNHVSAASVLEPATATTTTTPAAAAPENEEPKHALYSDIIKHTADHTAPEHAAAEPVPAAAPTDTHHALYSQVVAHHDEPHHEPEHAATADAGAAPAPAAAAEAAEHKPLQYAAVAAKHVDEAPAAATSADHAAASAPNGASAEPTSSPTHQSPPVESDHDNEAETGANSTKSNDEQPGGKHGAQKKKKGKGKKKQ